MHVSALFAIGLLDRDGAGLLLGLAPPAKAGMSELGHWLGPLPLRLEHREAYDAHFLHAASHSPGPAHHRDAQERAVSPAPHELLSPRMRKVLVKVLVPASALLAIAVVFMVYLAERETREVLSLAGQEPAPAHQVASPKEEKAPESPAPQPADNTLQNVTQKSPNAAPPRETASSQRQKGGTETPEKDSRKTLPEPVTPVKKEEVPLKPPLVQPVMAVSSLRMRSRGASP